MTENKKTKVIDTDSWWYEVENNAVSISCFMNKKPVKGVFFRHRIPEMYMSLGYVKIGKLKLCLKSSQQRAKFDAMIKEAWDVTLKPAKQMTVDYMSEKG